MTHRMFRTQRFFGSGWRSRAVAACSAAIGAAGLCSVAAAQLTPKELEEVGVTERLGERLPLDLAFTNESGETVTLGKYLGDEGAGKPIILTLNYYTCPMLCHLTLEGLVGGLEELEWTAGDEFEIVTVSINPEESPRQALAFKNAYMMKYGREADDGWHFHVGSEQNIKQLAEAVGFNYKYDEKTGEYAHTATIVFITPDGVISKYMDGVMFQSRDLRLALVEASGGKVGSPMDKILLFTCFQWDPDANSYVPVAWKVMRAGGALTMMLLASGLFVLWLRGTRHDHTPSDDAKPQAADL